MNTSAIILVIGLTLTLAGVGTLDFLPSDATAGEWLAVSITTFAGLLAMALAAFRLR